MAHSYHLSSPESDGSAVENIVFQAIELSVLEQVAALNTPHTSHSALPTHLETRFQKLQSFPPANPKLKIPSPCPGPTNQKTPKSLNLCRETPNSSPDEEIHCYSRSLSAESHTKADLYSEAPNPKSRIGSVSPFSISSNSFMEPSSPPPKTCCFWCSPNSVPSKKSKQDGVTSFELNRRGLEKTDDDDDILSDFSTFSVKEQERRLKKALREEERIGEEAEKVVKWVKQASARMDASVVEDSKSHHEKLK